MISCKTQRQAERTHLCKPILAAIPVTMALVCSPTASNAIEMVSIAAEAPAAITDQTQSESHRTIQKPENHIIKFDNSGGTEKIEFRENLHQRRCVARVTPDSLTLAPGETAEVHLDIRDSEASGCAGEPKYVLWRATAIKPGGRPLNYQMLFTENPREGTHGSTQIQSTRSARPGTPYAATCADRACFDDWAPRARSSSAIFFYEKR